MRRAVPTSAYPLAEWIAEHWWSLSQHVRPSAVPHSLWSWSQVRQQTWLCSHNTRAAGAGMPWPDLTVMPEGSFSRLLWNSGPALAGQPLTFLTSGSALVRCEAVAEALGRFVDQVLERLDDSGVRDTALHREWRLLQECDDEETAFAVAAARLGLDPFDVAVDTEAEILSLAAATSDEALLNEILDTADPGQLAETAGWLAEARSAASYRQRPVLLDPASGPDPARPWRTGYDTALSYRRQSLIRRQGAFPRRGLRRVGADRSARGPRSALRKRAPSVCRCCLTERFSFSIRHRPTWHGPLGLSPLSAWRQPKASLRRLPGRVTAEFQHSRSSLSCTESVRW